MEVLILRSNPSLGRSQAREQGLATMLFCVVAVFFFCNLLALVVNILEVGFATRHVKTKSVPTCTLATTRVALASQT